MTHPHRMLLSGNEAVARAALHAGIRLGTGYPGTPSTEILENFSKLGGPAQWAPNEKVALEVAIGAAFAGARSLVTMKHVGLNVAADPLFTVAYTGVSGALVIVSADDPGMASSQNEQDNRHYAKAAGLPMLEPADSQEAYDFTGLAVELSERFGLPVILRLTTRICHSKTVVQPGPHHSEPQPSDFHRDIKGRVMIPAYARPAHRRLRDKLDRIDRWNNDHGPNPTMDGDRALGIITSGVSFAHVRDAAPDAAVLKLGMSYPVPIDTIRRFARSVERCLVIEEGDPCLLEAIRAAGIAVEGKPEMYRFGELNVARIRRILTGDLTAEPQPPRGQPPRLCPGCPHQKVFELLHDRGCIVAGDIGCYTLGVLPPYEAMDTCVCMGASIGVGLGLRHVLPPAQARRVVSVIGDSTFVHSGITGLVEMVYNTPPTGHVLMILDNATTAMTGQQEHPGTGRRLDRRPTRRLVFEDLVRSVGISNVQVIDPNRQTDRLAGALDAALASSEPSVIITRRPCILASRRLKQQERPPDPSCQEQLNADA